MKRESILSCFVLLAFACNKDVEVDEVLKNLKVTPDQVFADGQSSISLSIELSHEANSDRRNVVFKTTSGIFTSSNSKTATAKAEYENGILTAKVSLRAPIEPTSVTVSAQPEFDSPIKEFVVSKSFEVSKSEAASAELVNSAMGLVAGFETEVLLTGNLKNSKGNYVSKNTAVVFDDVLPDGTRANGRFRNLKTLSNDTSRVSAFYGAPNYPVGTTIKVILTVLDEDGGRTNVKDSVYLTTINK